VAGGHALIRAGLRALLENLRGVQVVAEASDGLEALSLIRQHQPNLALIESAMPGLDGFEVTARVSREYPEVRVMILSRDADEKCLRRALSCGARGYLVMTASPIELELAVESIANGETHLSPSVFRAQADPLRDRAVDAIFESLTPRRREVLTLIAEGNSTKNIARLLNISVKTVETHRRLLMERLDIYNLAGLVRYAIEAGLVELDD